MPNIPSRGATSSAQELRDFISQQAASEKKKGKQARLDESTKEIYRKTKGTTWAWGRHDTSKKDRHKKIEALKTQMLEKFGPSYHDAIKSAFARQRTVALKDGTRVYKTGPTFTQLEHAITKGDKQVVQEKIDALKQKVADYSKFLTPNESTKLNNRIDEAEESLSSGDLETATLQLKGEDDFFVDERDKTESILDRAKVKAKRAATEEYRTLKFRGRELKDNFQVSAGDKQKINSQLDKIKNFIDTGHPDKALKAFDENIPGTSRKLADMIDHLKSVSVPNNFPNSWHSSEAREKVTEMNKELAFAGDNDDCFYQALALQLGITMQQVRQDLHAQAQAALQDKEDGDMIFDEITYNDLKEAVDDGEISDSGNQGDMLYAHLVAEKYQRPVTLIDQDGNTRTFNPSNGNGQPALVLAYNEDHFDAVIDKPQPQNVGNNQQVNDPNNGVQQNMV